MKKFFTTLLAVVSLVLGTSAQATFINEINYLASNPGQGFEIAGPAGQDLTGWSAAMYGADGSMESVRYFEGGLIPDQDNGYGSIWYDVEQGSRQSGGIALINPNGEVVQFLSYGLLGLLNSLLEAVDGPAAGMVAEYAGLQLLPSTSLELVGTGISYLDFLWSTPLGSTPGTVNTNQNFGGLLSILGIFGLSTPTDTQVDAADLPYGVTVFPNPTSSYVQVTITGAVENSTGTVELIDATGKLLEKRKIGTDATTIEVDLSSYQSGTYYLRVTDGKQQVVKPIVRT